jgi:mRNA interferase MazF
MSIVVPFPFSDLSTVKRRPALVVATPDGDDIVLCQITSQQIRDRYAVGITDIDFAEGTLRKPSNIRPNRLFSASTSLILYRAGRLNDQTVTSVIARIIEILQVE